MTRRIIFIVLGALLFALLIGLAWMWFFSGQEAPSDNTGTFGSADERDGSGGAGTDGGGNIPSNVDTVPGSAGADGNTGAGGLNLPGAGGSVTIDIPGYVDPGRPRITIDSFSTTSIGTPPGGTTTPPDVQWYPDGSPITTFTPDPVNQLNNNNVGGSPFIIGTNVPEIDEPDDFDALTGLGLGLGLCTAEPLISTALGSIGGLLGGIGGSALGAVLVVDIPANQQLASEQYVDTFLDCIARGIARLTLEQITASVVNWINSGFEGQPAFIENYEAFFTNVAERAAGDYIRGSSLSFLCSPFQAQVKIAIAQSYARRNNAPSCSLEGVVSNIESFMNGNFSAGGWDGLLSFVTQPTNNPFGAYSYGQQQLLNVQASAVNEANRGVTATGFVSIRDPKTGKITTPGGVVESTLSNALRQPFDQLNLADNFDEIISSLITQLTTRTLYEGLSNISDNQGYEGNFYTPAEQQAQKDAQSLMNTLQSRVRTAQQFGAVYQGMIRDVQTAQENLQVLANCWENKPATADTAQAAADALALRDAYDTQVSSYNAQITKANQAIATLQQLQTRLLNSHTPSQVNNVKNSYQNSTSKFISDGSLTNAQQNRTTLQSQLEIRNQQTSTQLQQCNAS